MRFRSKSYLKFVRGRPCVICDFEGEAHHLTFAEPNAMSLKVGDNWCVPMCHEHHMELHAFGNEKLFWDLQGIDALSIAEQLFGEWRKDHE
jgi:hypothetical protein